MADKPAAFQSVDVPTSILSKLLPEEALMQAAQIVEMLCALSVRAKVSPRIVALASYNHFLVAKNMIIDQDAQIQATFYEDSSRLMDLMMKDAPQDVKDKWHKREETAIKPS